MRNTTLVQFSIYIYKVAASVCLCSGFRKHGRIDFDETFYGSQGSYVDLHGKKSVKCRPLICKNFGKSCTIADFEKVMRLTNGTGATALAARTTCAARWRHGRWQRAVSPAHWRIL